MTFVASPRIRSVGCIYADRCVYAPDAAYSHIYLYAVVGAYTRVGAFTRALGAVHIYAAGAYIHTRVCIRGSVRIRERWVCIREGVCIRTPSRIHRFLCIHAPPTAFTQESTNRNAPDPVGPPRRIRLVSTEPVDNAVR